MEQDRNWHYMNPSEIERAFRTSSTGLTEAEAAKRTRTRRNRVWQVRGNAVSKYATKSFLDPSTILLLLSVLLAALYGEGAVAAAVLIMMLVAKVAEILAFTAADTLMRRGAEGAVPKARVVRDGSVREIPAEAVAEGDVIILDSGDVVPCDVRLTAAENVLAAESLIGGRSGLYLKNAEPISRHVKDVPLEMRSNMLYAGSTVVYGFCMGVAVATGKRTLRVQRDGVIELSGNEKVPVLDKLSEWSRMCRLVLVGVAFVMTVVGIIFGHGLINAFLPSVALAAACMSDFLAAFGALILAVALGSSYTKEGGIKEKTIFRCASKIEAAAHSDVIVLRSAALLKNGIPRLRSFYANGREQLVDKDNINVGGLTYYAAYASGMSYDGSGGEEATFLSAAELRAFRREYGGDKPGYAVVAHKKASEADAEGLDSSLICRDGNYVFCVIGEVSTVLSKCSRELVDGVEKPMSKERRAELERYSKRLIGEGVKLCAVAKRNSVYNSLRRLPVLLSELCFEGMIAISEKPEAECAEYIRRYRENGGSLVIFAESGDEDMQFARAYDIFRTGDIMLYPKTFDEVKSLPLDRGSLVMINCPPSADGAELRLRYLNIIKEKHRCVYVGFGAEDSICMQNNVSFAVESPLKRGSGVPQSLRCIADGIIESSGGGFCGAYRMIVRFRRVVAQTNSMLKFLITSQLARAFLLLVCAVLKLTLPSAAQMVFFGLVFDLCCAFCAIPSIKVNAKNEGMKVSPVPRSVGETLMAAVTGTLIAVSAVASPFIYKAVMAHNQLESATYTDKGLSGLLFAGTLLALSAVFVEMISSDGLFGKSTRILPVYFVPMLLSVVIVFVSYVMNYFGQAMNIEFAGWLSLVFALIPLLVSLIFLAAYRAYLKGKYDKK